MVKTTRAQREALYRKWTEMASTRRLLEDPRTAMLAIYATPTYKDFRKTVQPLFGGNGCIMVPWCGMWLGIETDGYCHS